MFHLNPKGTKNGYLMRLNLHFPQLVLCSFEDKTGIGKKEAIKLNWNNGFVLTAFIEYSTRHDDELKESRMKPIAWMYVPKVQRKGEES